MDVMMVVAVREQHGQSIRQVTTGDDGLRQVTTGYDRSRRVTTGHDGTTGERHGLPRVSDYLIRVAAAEIGLVERWLASEACSSHPS
jgi:hypothetical protein